MVKQQRFFYNADGGEGGSGGAEDSQQQQQQQQQSAEGSEGGNGSEPGGGSGDLVIPEEIQKELEELRQFKLAQQQQSAPAKTEEELKREQEIESANLLKFGVDNGLMSLDEYTQYESIKVKEDADLVFESFVNDFREENGEGITDEEELIEAAKEEFNKVYKLSSEKESVKQKGLAKLAKDAAEIRSPLESKFNQTKDSYSQEKTVRQKYPEFEKFIDEKIKTLTPNKLSVLKVKDGEKEIEVDIELTEADREAIAKDFKTPKTFLKFNEDGAEKVSPALEKKIQGWIKANKSEEINQKIFETAKSYGVTLGSNTGAGAPFPLRGQQSGQVKAGLTLEESNRRIAEARSNAS